MIQKINRLIQNQTSSDIKNCGNVRTFTYLNSLFNGNKIKMKPIPKILTSILFLIIIFNLISHQPWSSALRQCWAQSDPCCCKKKKREKYEVLVKNTNDFHTRKRPNLFEVNVFHDSSGLSDLFQTCSFAFPKQMWKPVSTCCQLPNWHDVILSRAQIAE